MGPHKDCVDIVTELGGIKDIDAAQQVIKAKLDASNLDKLQLPTRLPCVNRTLYLLIPDPRRIDNLSERFL
jgi:hypothetical protein